MPPLAASAISPLMLVVPDLHCKDVVDAQTTVYCKTRMPALATEVTTACAPDVAKDMLANAGIMADVPWYN